MKISFLKVSISVLLVLSQGLHQQALAIFDVDPDVKISPRVSKELSLLRAIRSEPKTSVTIRGTNSAAPPDATGSSTKQTILGQIRTGPEDALVELEEYIAECKNQSCSDSSLARHLCSFGYQLMLGGLYIKSECFLKEAINIQEQLGAAEQYNLGRSMSNLGVIYLEEGRLTEAKALLEEALKLRDGAPEDRFGVAKTQIQYGRLLAAEGDCPAAEFQLQSAIEKLGDNKVFPIREYSGNTGPFGRWEVLTTSHQESNTFQWIEGRVYYSAALLELANLYLDQKKYAEARKATYRAMDAIPYGNTQGLEAKGYQTLAQLDIDLGSFESAENNLELAETQIEQKPFVATFAVDILITKAALCVKRNQVLQAVALYDQAAEQLERMFGTNNARVAKVRQLASHQGIENVAPFNHLPPGPTPTIAITRVNAE